jgi:hypothetical protein
MKKSEKRLARMKEKTEKNNESKRFIAELSAKNKKKPDIFGMLESLCLSERLKKIKD